MDNAEDNRDLHLEGVEEHNLVDGNLPDWIHAEGVGGPVITFDRGVSAPGGGVDHHGLLVSDLVE